MRIARFSLLPLCVLAALPALAGSGARSDLDGDGRSDLVWRHVERGTNLAWLSGNHAFPVGLAPQHYLTWYIAAIGDFDGDGRDDLLWRGRGDLWPWPKDAVVWPGGIEADAYVYARIDFNMYIVGVADFDGDGIDDPLQQWETEVDNSRYVWKRAGIGDLDGDGRDDMVWRHSHDGRNIVYLGGDNTQVKVLATEPKLEWKIDELGDFDGDGHDDLLWRNSGNGMLVVWPRGDAAQAVPIARVADPDWQVAATGDYDADGMTDLVWRHMTTGANVMWRSANPRAAQPMAGVPDLRWRAIGGEDDDGQGSRK